MNAASRTPSQHSLKHLHLQAAQELMQAGFGPEEAMREARVLIQLATGMDVTRQLSHSETELSDAQQLELEALIHRRAESEPMAYLAGSKEFFGLEFSTSPATLIPRPDSETLVETALGYLPSDKAARVLDLGTGTGCLLLSVLHQRPFAHGVGVDIQPDAVGLAAHNARQLELAGRTDFHIGSWFTGLPEGTSPFDVILSNPPYITTREMTQLMPDVRDWEPRSALHGGEDGLDAYRIIAAEAANWLAPGGVLLFEIGRTQGADVAALGMAAGLLHRGTKNDLAGNARVVALQAPGSHAYLSNDLL